MSLTKVSYSMINGAVANVLDYGADPTGATDSSTAFQNAGATGKTIFVPKGLYQASFGLRNSQIIFGEGARNQSRIIPPAGAAYVIAIAANSLGTTSKQHCQIRDLSIENTNSVSNCVGIFFSGTDASTINDNHFVENVYINGFYKGIYVAGRLILATMINVEIDTCTKAFHAISDPANYAFNLNTFISCRFVNSVQEGINITGYNIANKFISCDVEGNNTANAVGVAGMYVQNAEGLFLDNPYFELNGGGTAVDAVNPLNNSSGLYCAGDRCFNLQVQNGWMVQSGTMIAVNENSGIIGGIISGVRFAPLSTGFDIYIGDKLNGINAEPFVIDSNNYFSGQLSIKTGGDGLTSAAVRQTSACQYVPGATTLDLRAANKFAVFNASGFNLNSITNRIPGMELWITNVGAGTVTIDASLMYSGSASSIAAGASKIYMVLGYPNVGKFVPMN